MLRDLNLNKKLIFVIPVIVLLWSSFANLLTGPFFLSRVDPEYPYLLNGLNCALLDFYRIGHTDHPGTPFQLLTGLFIRIIYWAAGEGTITEDVISRPELYLRWSSFFLTLMTSGIILWLGKIVSRQNTNLFGALVLQSSAFLNVVLIDLPTRYNPDRMLMIYVLIFAGMCYKYLYQETYSGRKYAIHSGILMGIAFMTKFNFLPLVIIPFIVVGKMKQRLIYLGTFLLSSLLVILPIYNQFSNFRRFISKLITHDGLYGQGTEQVINIKSFLHNIGLIFEYNRSFSIVFIASFILLIILLVKPSLRKRHKIEFLFLLAFMLVTALGIVMVAKHFKNYYLVPVFSLTGFFFYVIWEINRRNIRFRHINKIFALILILLIALPVIKLYPVYQNRAHKKPEHFHTFHFIENNISPTDYFFIEPTWLWGPMVTNGLVYGISYVGFRHYFYGDYQKFYPNIITYEGPHRSMQFFRMADADNEAILKSGRDIYILSTPGRNAETLYNYLHDHAQELGISLSADTVFTNSYNKEHIIRIQNNENWRTIYEGRCGFERTSGNVLLTDDEKGTLAGAFHLTTQQYYSGTRALKLDKVLADSPQYIINNVSEGDYFELTVIRMMNENAEHGYLVLHSSDPAIDSIMFTNWKTVADVGPKWDLVRLTAGIRHQPADSTVFCFFRYTGDGEAFIDDFTIKHFSRK